MSPDAVLAMLSAHAQAGLAPRERGDHMLNPGMVPREDLTRAGVLVPLVRRSEGLNILLTQRTAHLQAHAGQISFPGGRHEPQDNDLIATALRETREEVGIPPERIEVIATLDPWMTRTGYFVLPVVGVMDDPDDVLDPDPFEVDAVFEVPLSWFLAKGSGRVEWRSFKGRDNAFYAYPWQERYIWGATAGMLVNLVEVLGGVVPEAGPSPGKNDANSADRAVESGK